MYPLHTYYVTGSAHDVISYCPDSVPPGL